jgi:peptide/nickel transport system ATP-binding protein
MWCQGTVFAIVEEGILSVRGLVASYFLGKTRIVGVDGVDLDVGSQEILGLVGESGSGKTTLANAIVRSLKPPGKVTAGRIRYQGKDVLSLGGGHLRQMRWKEIAIIPQASQNALSPTRRVRDHFRDAMAAHGVRDKRVMDDTSAGYLKEVQLEPHRVLNAYPHELSGGMKQRVLIALSLVLEPKLIILDEPTSALDLITQETILALVKGIHKKTGVSMIFITHDISLVKDFATRTAVMYHGKIMEVGPTEEVLISPRNPYTRSLLLAIPKLHGDVNAVRSIPGNPPSPTESVLGCPFHPRCPFAREVCMEIKPPFEEVSAGHYSYCHFNQRLVLKEASR